MSLKVDGAYVYNVVESKATYLLATGVLTAAPLFFTAFKPTMNEDAFGALVSGQDMYTRDQLLEKLAARPVFLVRLVVLCLDERQYHTSRLRRRLRFGGLERYVTSSVTKQC